MRDIQQARPYANYWWNLPTWYSAGGREHSPQTMDPAGTQVGKFPTSDSARVYSTLTVV